MNKNTHNPNKNSGNDGPFAIFVLGLLACAIWSQKEGQIRFWLYQNLMAMTLYAFLAISLVVAYAVYRMKKKHENELSRARAIQSVKPTRNPRNYYERMR